MCKRVFVVVAAFNEDAVIGDVVRRLRQVYEQTVVVDDGSTDATTAEAVAAGATVLHHVINRGQGAALQTGITYSLNRGADVIVTFDADGQHRVSDIAPLIEPVLDGSVDVVLGSRFLGADSRVPRARRMLLRAGVLFTRLMSGVALTDTHNGLRAFSRRAAQVLDIRMDRMAHASEIIDQLRKRRLSYREVPVRVSYTPYSQAKGQRATGAFRILFEYLIGRLFP